MAEVEVIGHTIVRNAVPLVLVQELAGQIDRGLPVLHTRDKWTEYKPPVEAVTIKEELLSNSTPHGNQSSP